MNAITVLSVDDSSDDTLLFERACRKSSVAFNLQVVNDGQGAIDYLSGVDQFADRERFPLPSLLLLDLKMPRLNGFEVLKWIRQQTSSKDIPVAIFSSSQNNGDIQQAYQMGANWYVMKPVDYVELLEIVKTINAYLQAIDPDAIASLNHFRPPAN